jgi:hypothetical protein
MARFIHQDSAADRPSEETAQSQPPALPSLTVTSQDGVITLALHQGLTDGTHFFVRVTAETIAILKKWGADIDNLAKAADALMKNLNQIPMPKAVPEEELERQRTRLSQHKQALIAFLKLRRESVSRAEIIRHCDIPAGSLSAILGEPEFVQVEHGMWALRGILLKCPERQSKRQEGFIKEKPGASEPPEK